MAATPPVFINTNVQTILDETVAQFEALVGFSLSPAQTERLILEVVAYREGLVRAGVQNAAEQMLVAFSRAPALDYLAQLVGVFRLPASAALVDLTFTLVDGHTGVTIPVSTRVSTTDGKATFRTKAAYNVTAGVTTAIVTCECITPGIIGNGYTAGTITNILDPQAYLVSATNADETGGGADAETDVAMRQRINLAPGQYSTAGSEDAYKFHAFTANPAIIDVAVYSEGPGEVSVYPLLEDGTVTPGPILDAVYAAVNARKVRPLNDLVHSLAPTRTTYELDVVLDLFDTAIGTDVSDAVESSLSAYTLLLRQRLGRDVIESSLAAAGTVDGVYKISFTGWSDLIIARNEYAVCTAINITINSYVNG